MRFGILGPVEVVTDGGSTTIGQPRHRALLAYLLLHRNRVITRDQLTEALWGGAEPASATSQIHVAVSMLRRALRAHELDGILATLPVGYRLAVGDNDLDAAVFTYEVAAARRACEAGAHEDAANRLRAALALWRGRPLAGIQAAFAQPARQALDEQRLSAYELMADAELALGRTGSVAAQLSTLVEENPLRERLVARLMLALDRDGRGAEAIRLYSRLRERLADEFGADPGPELQELHLRLLRGTRGPQPAAEARMVPRQLPPTAPHFSGRARQLAILDKLIANPGQAVIAAIAGTAGVGKTALAVHWAHQVAHRYPDGQVYLNLQGFDRSGPMPPGAAIRSLLDALAPDAAGRPDGLDAQAGLYRSLLADRRVLILLDNARDADQVRPLLPGGPGCLTVITSRDQMFGLVAAEGAHPVVLDLLPAPEARDLLSVRLGHDRAYAERAAVDEIIERCAGLPLALAVVAARAAARPDFPLGALAEDLRAAGGGLDALSGGDATTDLRAVFSYSYLTLTTDAARLFRLLGLLTGPDFAASAAASLLGAPPARLRTLIAELIRAHLVTEAVPGRFAIHDLLRSFAAELVAAADSDVERAAAARRLLEHYLHSAYAADRLVQPHRRPVNAVAADAAVTIDAPPDHEGAMAWFTAESGALIAATGWAAEAGLDVHAWQLAWTLENFLDRRGRWGDWMQTQQTAVAAAGRVGDRRARADAYRGLAMALARLHRYEEAHVHYRDSLELWHALDDRVGQARTHRSIAHLLEQQGRHIEALPHAEQSLELFRAADDANAYARALNVLGWLRAQLGEHAVALELCEHALALLRDVGDRKAQGHTLDSLGFVHHQMGDQARAAECYRAAVAIFRAVGDRLNEATALDGQARAHRAGGDPVAAARVWRLALAILDDLRHPAADTTRGLLGGLLGDVDR